LHSKIFKSMAVAAVVLAAAAMTLLLTVLTTVTTWAVIYPEYRTLVTLLNCFAVDPTAVGEGQTGARLTDYVLELSFLGTLDGTFIQRGDANGDGQVTVTDIGVIVDKILGVNNNSNAASRRLLLQEVEPQ
jgi:hypothetical protein